jgi:hypothetical protein
VSPEGGRVWVHRPYQGLGDWLFVLAVFKLANQQRPDVELWATHRLPHGFPAQAFHCSDVVWKSGRPPAPFAEAADLIYRKWPPDNYIESTVHNLNDLTGLAIEYKRGVYPTFRGAERKPGDYVVMIGHGKKRERGGWEWGHRNFDQLAHVLARRYQIVQIGAAGDHPLVDAKVRMFGARFRNVAAMLAGAKAFVGIENGLTVLAGYLGVPQVTFYDGYQLDEPYPRPRRLDFDGQEKIQERIEPPEAAERVMAWLTGLG